MARTRKTAQILRALKIQAATSSSSSESDSLREETGPSLESLAENEAAQDGVPYAQTLAADEDATADGRNPEVESRDALSESDEGKDKQADPREAALCNDASQSDPDQASSSEEEKSSKVSSSNTSRGSRKRDIDDCHEELYYVPEIRRYHKSWKDLERYLKKYQKQTRTVVSISETQNVRLRNQNIAKMKMYVGKPDSEIPLVPEDLGPYQRVYICTHGWKSRMRSQGHRPRQKLKGVGCPMRFRAQLVQRTSGNWCIEVKKAFYGHNHDVSDEVYRGYPSVRQIPEESAIMRDVELMVSSGSKASRIYDYIRDRTPHYVQLKDVYNLIAKIKGSGAKLSDEDLVAETLVNFELEAPGNVAAVDENLTGQTAVITISSQHMRKLYKRFPEILLVDCTHKTNRYNYQLCTFMIMDQFGQGQAVQHSVIERNADWHMEKAVEQFQIANDWQRTKIIMVDKDLTEIEVLRRMFSDARILLCHFHVLKWLRGAIRDDKKYGTYPSDVLSEMDFCVHNMVYSKSKDEFEQHEAEFKALSCRDGRLALWNYFKANWIDCKEMWAMLYRMDLPHFRNNTNNRLENFFGKLKADLVSSMTMKQCLEATIRFQRRKEDEYVTRVVMPGSHRDITYDDEMNQLLGMTSEWLADVFLPEYKFAVNPGSVGRYVIDDEDLYVNFKRDGHTHRVDKFNWMCTCEFSATMKLPCRHGMLYRKHLARMLTIPYSSIPARWLRIGALDEELAAVDVPLRITTASMEVLRKKRMTESDKYKTAQNAFSRISTELVDLPDDQFTDALNHLEAWWTRLRQGHVEMPTPAASGGGSQPNSDADADVPTTQVAVETSADANEKDETVHNEGDELTGAARGKRKDTANQTSCTKIKLKPFNPRTTRVGRPKKNKAAAAAKLSQSRKAYNKGSKLRSALRGDDVVDIAEFVKSCEPPLSDLSSFLDTFEVRYQKHKFKQLSVLRRVPEATVVPYRLPEALVREGLSLIERKIPYGFIMDVSTPVEPTEECWVLSVDGIGDFTQHQLMAMQYLWALVNSCRQGMQCYSWLMGPVDATFPNEDASGVAKRIYEEWPLQRLPGFGEGLQIQWTHLYCAGSGCWYNDNLIMAFAKTLEVTFQGNTTILLPPMKIPDTQTTKKHGHLPPRTLSLISAAAKGLVFLPLNLNGNHWTCLVVDGSKATIYCYDSMDKRANNKLLTELAEELVTTCLPVAYQITPVHSPIQNDGDSCGLFVCLFFWRRFLKEAGNDYSSTGLLRRRWDVLKCILDYSDESTSKAKDNS